MTPEEYTNFYNEAIKEIPSEIPVCAAGMVNGPEFLESCWNNLERKPDMVNKHYPNTKEELIEYWRVFKRPVVVGEWCYKTATQQEMIDWIFLLDRYSAYHSWFCLDERMHKNMGLYSSGRITAAGTKYRKALSEL